jgi:hypothetical protein
MQPVTARTMVIDDLLDQLWPEERRVTQATVTTSIFQSDIVSSFR